MKCTFSKHYLTPARNHPSEFTPCPSSVTSLMTGLAAPPWSLLAMPIFVRWRYTHASSHDAHRPRDTVLPRFQSYHIHHHPILITTICSNRILPAIPPSPFHHLQQLLYQTHSPKYPHGSESDLSLKIRRRDSSQPSSTNGRYAKPNQLPVTFKAEGCTVPPPGSHLAARYRLRRIYTPRPSECCSGAPVSRVLRTKSVG